MLVIFQVHCDEYPELAKMARDYLGACGTGIPVEKVVLWWPTFTDTHTTSHDCADNQRMHFLPRMD
jgi:hypothetical protein